MGFKSFFNKIGNGIKSAGQWVGKQASYAWKDIKGAVSKVGNTVLDITKRAANAGIGMAEALPKTINTVIIIIGVAIGGVLLFGIMNPAKTENMVVKGLSKIPGL